MLGYRTLPYSDLTKVNEIFYKKGKATVDLIIISCNLVFPDFVQIRIKTKKKKSVKSK